jgi:hypothetical protein
MLLRTISSWGDSVNGEQRMSERTLEEWAKEVLGWAESFGSTWEFMGDDNCEADKLHEEGKAILERPAQPQWVSVEDRLPEVAADVWVHRADGTIQTGWLRPGRVWGPPMSLLASVTHWMPLERPEPPQNAPGGPKEAE